MTSFHKFDKDEILGESSLVFREPERDGVPEAVVDAVDLFVVPALYLQ